MKIVMLIAAVSFMASNASANGASAAARAKSTGNLVSKRSPGLGQRLTSNKMASKLKGVANGSALSNAVIAMFASIEFVERSIEGADSIMAKDTAVNSIADLVESAVDLGDNFEAVQSVYTGKVLDALKGKHDEKDRLNEASIKKFKEFDTTLKGLLANGMDVEIAKEQASQQVTGESYRTFSELCGQEIARAKR